MQLFVRPQQIQIGIADKGAVPEQCDVAGQQGQISVKNQSRDQISGSVRRRIRFRAYFRRDCVVADVKPIFRTVGRNIGQPLDFKYAGKLCADCGRAGKGGVFRFRHNAVRGRRGVKRDFVNGGKIGCSARQHRRRGFHCLLVNDSFVVS